MSAIVSPPESIRLSKRTKDQLITLKRKTGIRQWNVLCRWALCQSLAMTGTPPLPDEGGTEGGIEMTWRVFSGADGDLLWAALVLSCPEDVEPSTGELGRLLRAHIVRGIQLLLQSVRSKIGDLLEPAV